MVRPPRIPATYCLLALLVLAGPGRALAASPGFVLQRSAVAAAGGVVASAGMVLGLSAAQSVTGTSSGGALLHESAGFWTGSGGRSTVGVGDPAAGPPPLRFALDPVSPNPVAGNAELRYTVPAADADANLNVSVYDVSGRLVQVLASGPQAPGLHRVSWNGTNARGARLGSGIYFVALSAPSVHLVRRLVLLR